MLQEKKTSENQERKKKLKIKIQNESHFTAVKAKHDTGRWKGRSYRGHKEIAVKADDGRQDNHLQ